MMINDTTILKASFKNIQTSIIECIQNSKYEIKIAVAWFTNKEILGELIEKLDNGVKISILISDDIEGTKGLYEARIKLGSDIWRVFCFFDKGRLVILLNGFQKKSQKTPISEIEKALKLMNEYYKEKGE